MGPKMQVGVYGNSQHVHQVLTGCLLLRRQFGLELGVDFRAPSEAPSKNFVTVDFAGFKLAYDMDDGELLDPRDVDDFVQSRDRLYRRSMTAQARLAYQTGDRHFPFGLNYHATAHHPLFVAMAKRYSQGARSVASSLKCNWRDHYRSFEVAPKGEAGSNILFSARVWDPRGEPQESFEATSESVERRDAMNKMRADVVRSLRSEYGSNFVGGLAPSPYALKAYPDCVVDPAAVRPTTFRAKIRSSDICVATRGLQHSNGWKLAEYVAASKAIVAERPVHQIPSFHDGQHYAGFESVDECVAQVEYLLSRPEKVVQMASENRLYYSSYVRPDQLVLRSLEDVAGPLAGEQ